MGLYVENTLIFDIRKVPLVLKNIDIRVSKPEFIPSDLKRAGHVLEQQRDVCSAQMGLRHDGCIIVGTQTVNMIDKHGTQRFCAQLFEYRINHP